MKLKFLFFGLLFSIISFAQNTAKVSGIITDKDSKQPVSFASISLKGSMINAESDIDGKYEISMQPGNYTIVYAFIGYKTFEKQVTVSANENLVLNISLQENSNSIEGIVIKGSTNKTKETALLKEQQKAVEIKQSIGSQELSRKGISDVEEGLTKVSGITKVDSRGIFVRGLEDRYNSLLINNLSVPSNSPFKKILPLDLIPTDVVGIIETYKTFNPNLYGDFAGGTFNVETTTKPINSFTKISFGTSFVTNNNISNFLFAKNTNTTKGFFGFDGNDRNLPSNFNESNPFPLKKLDGQVAIDAFKDGFDVVKTKTPLNTSFGLTHAEKFNTSIGKFSYLLSLNFDNSYVYRKGVDRTLNPNQQIEYYNNFIKTTYTYKTNASSILGLNYSVGRLNLSSNMLYLKSTESQIQSQLGTQSGLTNTTNYYIQTNQFEQTDYLLGQLFGDYDLTSNKKHQLKGGVSAAKTKFNQPDRKSFTGTKESDNQINASYGGNNFLRQYFDVKNDVFVSGFLEYNYTFGAKDNKLTFGYNGNRNYNETKYRFVNAVQNYSYNSAFVVDPYNVDAQINQDLLDYKISFQESSNNTWKTKIEESVQAGYTNLLIKVTDKFDVNAGVRAENYVSITKYKEYGATKYTKVDKNLFYLLPSVNLKYAVNDNSNLRLAASQTYTKPVSMEAYPLGIVNPDNTVYQGNAYLENSKNNNVDLKYEIFPTAKEMFAVGVFGKNIQNPIERTFMPNSGVTITTFLNSTSANLYGVEAEFIFDFGRISNQLKDFSLGFNTSVMQTKVTVPNFVKGPSGNIIESIETHKSRNLQGASNWLINSDLKYQFNLNKNWSNTITAVYSVFGKRIYSVGTAGVDHLYEMPVSKLDIVMSSKINKHFDLKFSADNVLNPYSKFMLGDNNTKTYIETSSLMKDFKKGVGFSFTLGYTF
jgi:outer membrane receptor protein involved in Fe transport